jgi:hypothetical protein
MAEDSTVVGSMAAFMAEDSTVVGSMAAFMAVAAGVSGQVLLSGSGSGL